MWLLWVLVAAWAFLQLRRVGATLWLWRAGLSWWLRLLGSRGAKVHRLQGSVIALVASRAQAQQWCCLDLAAPQHVESSRIGRLGFHRDWTCVSCTGRQILDQWVTREALKFSSFKWGLLRDTLHGIQFNHFKYTLINIFPLLTPWERKIGIPVVFRTMPFSFFSFFVVVKHLSFKLLKSWRNAK